MVFKKIFHLRPDRERVSYELQIDILRVYLLSLISDFLLFLSQNKQLTDEIK